MAFFLRQVRVIVGDLNLSELRVSFSVEKTLVGYPNKASLQIYNMSAASREAIEAQGLRIELYAGYVNGNVPLIFAGNIINVIHIKQGTEWITTIYALDSATALNTATINKTIAPGATADTILTELVDSIDGVTRGITEGLSNCLNNRRSLLRQLELTGDVKKWLKWLAEQCGFDYSINDGVLETTEINLPLTDDEPFIINQKSGMIGSPERTDVGVTVRNLLLPGLRLGRRIQIQSITEQLNVGNLYFRKVPPIRNEGVYRIDKLIHIGDTHDNPWQTEISGRNYPWPTQS